MYRGLRYREQRLLGRQMPRCDIRYRRRIRPQLQFQERGWATELHQEGVGCERGVDPL